MKVRIVLVGARGYATAYLRPLLDNIDSKQFDIAGIIARDISKSPYVQEITSYNIPVFRSLEAFFESGRKADLVIIATPPHLHAKQSILSVNNGANVLCEKPVAPLYVDALSMKAASEKTGKFIGIGYQWSFSDAIQELKRDILSGKLGKAKELKSFVSWPRNWDYYDGSWKGKIRDENGTWILDSIAGNAAAHYLHNMFFVLGETMDTCEFPNTIRGELFRANKIENFDTCLLDITTNSGVRVFFAASHATAKNEDPKFMFEFENAVVHFNIRNNNNRIVAEFADGSRKEYGDPGAADNNVLWAAIAAVHSNVPPICVVKTALAHTFTINQLCQIGRIVDFPEDLLIRNDETRMTIVNGLYELMHKAFREGKLLSDMGISWVKRN